MTLPWEELGYTADTSTLPGQNPAEALGLVPPPLQQKNIPLEQLNEMLFGTTRPIDLHQPAMRQATPQEALPHPELEPKPKQAPLTEQIFYPAVKGVQEMVPGLGEKVLGNVEWGGEISTASKVAAVPFQIVGFTAGLGGGLFKSFAKIPTIATAMASSSLGQRALAMMTTGALAGESYTATKAVINKTLGEPLPPWEEYITTPATWALLSGATVPIGAAFARLKILAGYAPKTNAESQAIKDALAEEVANLRKNGITPEAQVLFGGVSPEVVGTTPEKVTAYAQQLGRPYTYKPSEIVRPSAGQMEPTGSPVPAVQGAPPVVAAPLSPSVEKPVVSETPAVAPKPADVPAAQPGKTPEVIPGTKLELTPKQRARYEAERAAKEPKPEVAQPVREEPILDVRKLTPEEAAKQDAVRAELNAELAAPSVPVIEQTPETLAQLRSLRSKIWARAAVQKLPEPEVRAIIQSVAGVDHLREIDNPEMLQKILSAVKPMPTPPELTPEAAPTPEELAQERLNATTNEIARRIGAQAPPPRIDPTTGGVLPPDPGLVKRWWLSNMPLHYIALKLDGQTPDISDTGDITGGPLWTVIHELTVAKQNAYRKHYKADRRELRDKLAELYDAETRRKMSYETSKTPALIPVALSGGTVNLTVAQYADILGTIGRPGSAERLMHPDGWYLEKLARRTKLGSFRSDKYETVKMPPLTKEDVATLIANAPQAVKDVLAPMRENMSGPAFDQANAVRNELDGKDAYPVELRDTYWPRQAQADWKLHNEVPENTTRDILEPATTGASQFKRSDPNANTPIVIMDAFRRYDRYILDRDLLIEVGLAAKQAYAVVNHPKTLGAIRSVKGDAGVRDIQQLLPRYVGVDYPENWFDSAIKHALRNSVTAIVASVRIGVLQLTSNPLAAFFLDADVMAKRMRPITKADMEYAKQVKSLSEELLARAVGVGVDTDMALSENDINAWMFGDKIRGFFSTFLARWMDTKTADRLILMIHDQYPNMTDEQVARLAEEITMGTQGVSPSELRGLIGGSQSAMSKIGAPFSSFREVMVRLYDQTVFDYTTNPKTKGDKKLLFKRVAVLLTSLALGQSLIRWGNRILKRMAKGEWDWKDGKDLLRQETFGVLGDMMPGYFTGPATSLASQAVTGRQTQIRTDPVSDTIALTGTTFRDTHKFVQDTAESIYDGHMKRDPATGEEVFFKEFNKVLMDALKVGGRVYGNGIPEMVYTWGKGGYDLLMPKEQAGQE